MTLISHVKNSLCATFPVRAPEWAMAYAALTWGIIVMVQSGEFVRRPGFEALLDIAPQHVWGGVAAAVGATRLVVLLFNGTVRRSPHIRAVMAFLSCFLWMQILFGLLTDGFTGLAMYSMALGFDFYNVLRAAREAALTDKAARHGQDHT